MNMLLLVPNSYLIQCSHPLMLAWCGVQMVELLKGLYSIVLKQHQSAPGMKRRCMNRLFAQI